ncbi:MAG TPA: sigma-70 family RNA polymerase sigma factor [Gaiellaceae bacterium]|nr:sigma-70 family RNA polymerase sigma factor [Gaiellaceae bacterium]
MTTTTATVAPGVTAAQLYEQYGNKIYRYCFGRLRDREEAADAVQNTFLRVHVALEKGVVPQYEASWLYKIAHNVCLSWIESSGRRALVETPRDLDSLDEAALAAPASGHEASEALAEALAALPHNLRHAILLREWQGLSYAEIAAAMDTTVSAVETLIVRARRQMAATLERSGTRLRRAAAAMFDALGLRGLLSGGLGKVSAGAALVALGGSGIGATVALSGRPSSPPARPATTIAGPTVAALPSRTTATAPPRLPREPAAPVSGAARRVSTPAATRPGVSSPLPAVPTVTVMSPVPAPGGTVPSQPQATSVSTTTTLPSVPTLPQVGDAATVPQLPVTTPTLAVPAVTIPVPAGTTPVPAVTTSVPAVTIP